MKSSVVFQPCLRGMVRFLPCANNFLCRGLFLVVAAVWMSAAGFGATKWDSVPPEDLAATASKSAPGSDIEVLFSRHTLDCYSGENYLLHYVRVKIYTQKGVERQSIIYFDSEKRHSVANVQARVVRPDSTSVELKKEDVKVTTLVKKGGVEIRRTAFAFPDVRPGDVLEYRWDEGIPTGADYSTLSFTIYCQEREIPVREWSFDVVKSAKDYNIMWFNCPEPDRKAKSQKVVFRNLQPFFDEQDMPPEKAFRGWILILFTSPYLRFYNENSAWEEIGDYLAENFRLETNPDRAIRDKAAELTKDAATPEEKLQRLCRFCQRHIVNLDWNASAEAAEAKKKREEEDDSQTGAKTLSRGSGLPSDIQRLFAALARAAGFEVRIAIGNDRHEMLDLNSARAWVFADRSLVAVKLGETWKFFAPGNPYIEPGMIPTNDEGAHEYVCDEKKSQFTLGQIAPPELTVAKRIGHFTLDADGNLDGNVEIQMTGHRAYLQRYRWLDSSEDDIKKDIRTEVSDRLPNAELSDITWENLKHCEEPFMIRYKVHVPGFAETIGTRLAFVPNFFQVNSPARFTAEERKFPVFFDYAEQQHDKIEIVLPPDFSLDGASAPAPAGKPTDIINAQYKIGYSPKSHTLKYQRDYTLGVGGVIDFQVASYPVLRNYFSRISKSDTHQILIKPKPATAPAESDGKTAPASEPAAK